jgi:hypothetical protein
MSVRPAEEPRLWPAPPAAISPGPSPIVTAEAVADSPPFAAACFANSARTVSKIEPARRSFLLSAIGDRPGPSQDRKQLCASPTGDVACDQPRLGATTIPLKAVDVLEFWRCGDRPFSRRRDWRLPRRCAQPEHRPVWKPRRDLIDNSGAIARIFLPGAPRNENDRPAYAPVNRWQSHSRRWCRGPNRYSPR